MTSHKIAAVLEATLRAKPDAHFDLLVRVDQADDQAEKILKSAGLEVRRRFRMVPSFAVSGRGAAALALLDHPRVQRIEEDWPVHTM